MSEKLRPQHVRADAVLQFESRPSMSGRGPPIPRESSLGLTKGECHMKTDPIRSRPMPYPPSTRSDASRLIAHTGMRGGCPSSRA